MDKWETIYPMFNDSFQKWIVKISKLQELFIFVSCDSCQRYPKVNPVNAFWKNLHKIFQKYSKFFDVLNMVLELNKMCAFEFETFWIQIWKIFSTTFSKVLQNWMFWWFSRTKQACTFGADGHRTGPSQFF